MQEYKKRAHQIEIKNQDGINGRLVVRRKKRMEKVWRTEGRSPREIGDGRRDAE